MGKTLRMKKVSDIEFLELSAKGYGREHSKSKLVLKWLGQGGFEIFYKDVHLLIDPYLSDYLAKKYKCCEFDHVRMMPPPVISSEIKDLNFIFCTHEHADHLDPETVPLLLNNNPACKLIAPKAEKEYILKIVQNENQIKYVNAYYTIEHGADLRVEVLPSAHEDLKTDSHGNYYCLGYILQLGDLKIYHSGDCVPFVSLEQELKKRKVDIALLPVNGRDEFRCSKGIVGNFTFEESVELCSRADIPVMICQHFGMFRFNTVDENLLKTKAKAASNNKFTCIVPKAAGIYKISFK
jgi:L-ascorbate metabolism protein UlaG (beta-lactamase superfamily)